jgi:hypothetical protein
MVTTKAICLEQIVRIWDDKCKPISIPLEQNMMLSAYEGDLVEDTIMCRRIVRSLIYMTITRPYLTYVVGMVNQFMQTPRKPHVDAMNDFLLHIINIHMLLI